MFKRRCILEQTFISRCSTWIFGPDPGPPSLCLLSQLPACPGKESQLDPCLPAYYLTAKIRLTWLGLPINPRVIDRKDHTKQSFEYYQIFDKLNKEVIEDGESTHFVLAYY